MLQQVYDSALAKGINWFDTADSYGTGALNGQSEKLLGKFTQISKQTRAQICTKIAPFPWRVGKESIRRCIADSQARLNKPIDILQLHWPPALGWQLNAYLDAFALAVDDGQVVQMGASNFGPRGLRKFQSELQIRGHQVYSNQVYVVHCTCA